METVMLAVAIIGVLLGIIGLVCLIILLIKSGHKNNKTIDDIIERFDESTENLHEAVTILNEHNDKTIGLARDHIVSNFNTANQSITPILTQYMERFSKQMEDLASNTKLNIVDLKEEVKKSMDALNQNIKQSLVEMKTEIRSSITEMKDDVDKKLSAVREDNEKQLEKMRETVDEKLSSTLDSRIKTAFQLVNDRLDAVQKGFGEMQSLSERVGNLNKAFTNVKTRGTWGEVALQTLLEQILAPNQYERQFNIDKKNMVDFAIVMPGQADNKVYLPIDAKFPVEDYNRLVDASELGDMAQVEIEKKKLIARIKEEAKSISSKYINPPKTTNFAIMYVPTEGLYAEIIKDSDLCGELQNTYHITVCGPTTISALLNSLQMGFTTLQIQKKSGEIVKLMGDFKKDFGKFTGLIDGLKKKTNGLMHDLEAIDTRNGIIQRKLAKVDGMSEILGEQNTQAIEGELDED